MVNSWGRTWVNKFQAGYNASVYAPNLTTYARSTGATVRYEWYVDGSRQKTTQSTPLYNAWKGRYIQARVHVVHKGRIVATQVYNFGRLPR